MAATGEMTIRIEMDDEVRAIFDHARRQLDAMRPVVEASVRLFSCQCEFEDYGLTESACGELAEHWADAVIAYKRTASEVEL